MPNPITTIKTAANSIQNPALKAEVLAALNQILDAVSMFEFKRDEYEIRVYREESGWSVRRDESHWDESVQDWDHPRRLGSVESNLTYDLETAFSHAEGR